MVKAGALRKRYVLFSLSGIDPGEDELRRSLYSEALAFFGELGLSYAALKLVSYDTRKKTGIIRCERTHLERVLGFLALLSALGGTPARMVALRSSGTLKSLQEPSTQPR